MKKSNLFFAIASTLLTLSLVSCGSEKTSESSTNSETSFVHQTHENDGYGFCKEGKEWLGSDLVMGMNSYKIEEDTAPIYLRVDLANFATFSIPAINITDTSEAFPYDIKSYIVEEDKLVFSSEINYLDDVAFCNKLVGESRTDYLYFKLDFFSGTGLFGIILGSYSYTPVVIHNPNDYGYCFDCEEYVGEEIDINIPSQTISTENEMKTSSGKMRAFYRFSFSKGKDYEMLRRNYDGLGISFAIRNEETNFTEVDIKELVSTNAYDNSIDGKIYLSVYKKSNNKSDETTPYKIQEYYHVDDCGFDENSVYHGVNYDTSIGLDNTGFTYPLGYKWYIRYQNIAVGSTFNISLFTNVFQYKYYIRSLKGELKEVTDISTKTPINVENQNDYEMNLYIVITKIGEDEYMHYLTINEIKCVHSEVDENRFCKNCGLFTGEKVEVGVTVSNLNMNKDEVKFFCFEVTPGASYYKLVTNFMASEFEFFAFDKTTHEKISVSVPNGEGNAVEAAECLDNIYYMILKPTANTSNGSFTIYKVN